METSILNEAESVTGDGWFNYDKKKNAVKLQIPS